MVKIFLVTHLSAITVTNVSESFYLQHGGKNQSADIDMEHNYVTVSLCIQAFL